MCVGGGMVFSSYEFLFLFLPIALLGVWLLRGRHTARGAWLLLVSNVFYGYWNPAYLPLIWFSVGVDYLAGGRIAAASNPRTRRLWLYASLAMNLGSLGFFKYYNFFTDSLNTAAGGALLPVLGVVLPVGISFYTFQSMSYTIDIYRGEVQPAPNFFRFALFVTLFPQLIAGPIVRYSELAEQLNDTGQRITAARVDRGIFFFVMGLAKKVIIADQIAFFVDPLLVTYEDLQFWGTWLVALGYTYQLYFDFSGYSDMAVGLGCLLGYDFPRNFNNPYTARNISDFWRRWHITLSNWLRDYLFISLGGSRWGALATLRNLLLTMLLGGLWHGAAWTYVLWGAYHGVLLALFHAYRLRGLPRWNPLVARAGTFLLVVLGWVLFRASSWEMAWYQYQSMLGLHGIESWGMVWALPRMGVYLALLVGSAAVLTNLRVDTWDLRVTVGWWLGLLLALTIMLLSSSSPFLYFQF